MKEYDVVKSIKRISNKIDKYCEGTIVMVLTDLKIILSLASLHFMMLMMIVALWKVTICVVVLGLRAFG